MKKYSLLGSFKNRYSLLDVLGPSLVQEGLVIKPTADSADLEGWSAGWSPSTPDIDLTSSTSAIAQKLSDELSKAVLFDETSRTGAIGESLWRSIIGTGNEVIPYSDVGIADSPGTRGIFMDIQAGVNNRSCATGKGKRARPILMMSVKTSFATSASTGPGGSRVKNNVEKGFQQIATQTDARIAKTAAGDKTPTEVGPGDPSTQSFGGVTGANFQPGIVAIAIGGVQLGSAECRRRVKTFKDNEGIMPSGTSREIMITAHMSVPWYTTHAQFDGLPEQKKDGNWASYKSFNSDCQTAGMKNGTQPIEGKKVILKGEVPGFPEGSFRQFFEDSPPSFDNVKNAYKLLEIKFNLVDQAGAAGYWKKDDNWRSGAMDRFTDELEPLLTKNAKGEATAGQDVYWDSAAEAISTSGGAGKTLICTGTDLMGAYNEYHEDMKSGKGDASTPGTVLNIVYQLEEVERQENTQPENEEKDFTGAGLPAGERSRAMKQGLNAILKQVGESIALLTSDSTAGSFHSVGKILAEMEQYFFDDPTYAEPIFTELTAFKNQMEAFSTNIGELLRTDDDPASGPTPEDPSLPKKKRKRRRGVNRGTGKFYLEELGINQELATAVEAVVNGKNAGGMMRALESFVSNLQDDVWLSKVLGITLAQDTGTKQAGQTDNQEGSIQGQKVQQKLGSVKLAQNAADAWQRYFTSGQKFGVYLANGLLGPAPAEPAPLPKKAKAAAQKQYAEDKKEFDDHMALRGPIEQKSMELFGESNHPRKYSLAALLIFD